MGTYKSTDVATQGVAATRSLDVMGRSIYFVTRRLAWFGGFVLAVMALLSVVSIAGRAMSGFGLGPVPGDFELVEAGTALAVFCFLPWCHLRQGHATVDLFWNSYPEGMRRVLEIVSDVLMLVLWVLLVWRMGVATHDYFGNGETTFILQVPVWWGYAASMVPAVLGCVAYAWRVFERLGWVSRPEPIVNTGGTH
ncbi:TRAP transporter small permease [Denitromonas iodatirespirans]|uniref:TRAP transporter small permease protein n=1 Tax=Denitromonas iodatirespirans TaxID=2795389 RepID=A0A944DFH2_DENI1|nr:TRAP transporter small permease [Denitromonas iodatirespirans]MBT0964021.1 TRAP transporter small permease [Denitromonas iodatirespirans]